MALTVARVGRRGLTLCRRPAHSDALGFLRARLLLLALLGYLFLVGASALGLGVLLYPVLALLGLDGWLDRAAGRDSRITLLSVALLITTYVVHLWLTRAPRPVGVRLGRAQAPALFATIDQITATLGGPRIHAVWITRDHNAAIIWAGRGPFGRSRAELLLGFTLMHALSPEQFRAVLAHEIGHLAHAHGRLFVWLCSTQATWLAMLDRAQPTLNPARAFLDRFARWYAPRFVAGSSGLRHQHEYQADQRAALVSGPRHLADALIQSTVTFHVLDEVYWPAVHTSADSRSEPPRPFSRLIGEPEALLPSSGRVTPWLEAAMRETTSDTASHPALADRLAALGEAGRLPTSTGISAAAVWLRDNGLAIARELDRQWLADVLPVWRKRDATARAAALHLREPASR